MLHNNYSSIHTGANETKLVKQSIKEPVITSDPDRNKLTSHHYETTDLLQNATYTSIDGESYNFGVDL